MAELLSTGLPSCRPRFELMPMTHLTAVLALLFALPTVFLGYGRLFGLAVNRREKSMAMLVAIGVGASVFVGGLLNLGRVASTTGIWIFMAVGFSAAYFELRERLVGKINLPGLRPEWLLGVAAIAFAVCTQYPPTTYNDGDDFMKYFNHPVRMLETGTVYGSRLSAIGSETLGGMAFLHGMLLCVLPVQYINGVDAVLGLALCCCLAASLSRTARFWQPLVGLLCVAAVILIEPQYVNISGLYIPALLIMALTKFGVRPEPPLSTMALLYAALLAIKSSLIIFVLPHMVVVAVLRCIDRRPNRIPALSLFSAASIGYLAPWLLVHVDSFRAARKWVVPSVGSDIFDLRFFSTDLLPNGGTMASYSLLIIACAGLGLIAVGTKASRQSLLLATAMGFVTSLIITIVFLGPLSGYLWSTRFFTPVAIGCAPAIYAAFSSWIVPSLKGVVLGIVIFCIPLAAFLPSAVMRYSAAVRLGTLLDFPKATAEHLRQMTDIAFSETTKSELTRAQQAVPAGEPLIAWVKYPFYLDFNRNPINDIDVAGLATPWADPPPVRYMLWDQNPAIRQSLKLLAHSARVMPGARERVVLLRAAAAIRYFGGLTAKGELIYQSGSIAVYRIPSVPGQF
jgi:hypothetical protein